MPISAQSADGVVHEFPDGTDDAVVDRVMKSYAQSKGAAEPAPKNDGVKESVVDSARSIPGGLLEGAAGIAGLPGLAERAMDIPARAIAKLVGGKTGDVGGYALPTPQDITKTVSAPFGGEYQPQTTAGKYARTIASFAPAALTPGGAIARAARVAIPGAASEAAGEATEGTPYEPYARAGGAIAGSLAIPAFQATREATARAFTGTGPTPAAQDAIGAGYSIPPNQISKNPGIASRLMSAASGKIKLQQAASAKNQDITNGLAAEALGLHRDTPLSGQVFDAVRQSASRAYSDVAAAVPEIVPDAAFKGDVSGLGPRIAAAAKAFPGLVDNKEITELSDTLANAGNFPPQAGLELVRHLRSDAAANIKNFSDPAKQALGLSQRQAAEAVDNLMERNISAAGQPDAVSAYRAARQTLARTYDIEAATNSETGDVSGRVLAALAKKGRPLTGQLRDIANAASAFPKAMQNPATFGGKEDIGILDLGAGVLSGGATVPLSLARPGARSILLSRPYQNALMRASQAYPSTIGDNPLAALLAVPNALRKPNALERANYGAQ